MTPFENYISWHHHTINGLYNPRADYGDRGYGGIFASNRRCGCHLCQSNIQDIQEFFKTNYPNGFLDTENTTTKEIKTRLRQIINTQIEELSDEFIQYLNLNPEVAIAIIFDINLLTERLCTVVEGDKAKTDFSWHGTLLRSTFVGWQFHEPQLFHLTKKAKNRLLGQVRNLQEIYWSARDSEKIRIHREIVYQEARRRKNREREEQQQLEKIYREKERQAWLQERAVRKRIVDKERKMFIEELRKMNPKSKMLAMSEDLDFPIQAIPKELYILENFSDLKLNSNQYNQLNKLIYKIQTEGVPRKQRRKKKNMKILLEQLEILKDSYERKGSYSFFKRIKNYFNL